MSNLNVRLVPRYRTRLPIGGDRDSVSLPPSCRPGNVHLQASCSLPKMRPGACGANLNDDPEKQIAWQVAEDQGRHETVPETKVCGHWKEEISPDRYPHATHRLLGLERAFPCQPSIVLRNTNPEYWTMTLPRITRASLWQEHRALS